MMNLRLSVSLLAAGLVCAGHLALAADGAASPAESPTPTTAKELPAPSTKQNLTFATDIKPLFEASCVRCHGERNPKAALRLDILDGLHAGSEDGKVIVPGDSANSKLVQAIARLNPRTAMPPEPRRPRGQGNASTNAPAGQRQAPPPPKPLTAEEVGLVRAWIDQGAK